MTLSRVHSLRHLEIVALRKIKGKSWYKCAMGIPLS